MVCLAHTCGLACSCHSWQIKNTGFKHPIQSLSETKLKLRWLRYSTDQLYEIANSRSLVMESLLLDISQLFTVRFTRTEPLRIVCNKHYMICYRNWPVMLDCGLVEAYCLSSKSVGAFERVNLNDTVWQSLWRLDLVHCKVKLCKDMAF